MFNKSGVYKITCLDSGNFYIGSTTRSFNYRWKIHKRDLRKNKHHSNRLQNAYNKYGEKSFLFSVIEVVASPLCLKREQYYLDLLVPEYNICKTAGNTFGRKHSDETKRKIGLKALGRKYDKSRLDIHTASMKRGSEHYLFGKKHTEHSKALISAAKKGKKMTSEFKAGCSKRYTGHGNPKAKKVINTKTLEVYDCAKYVIEKFKLIKSTFIGKLNGRSNNNTGFMYLDQFKKECV